MVSKKKKVKAKRSTKSSWRRSNIRDIENYLEKKRGEERVGSKSQKTDDELFIIHRNVKNAVNKANPKRSVLETIKPKFKYLDDDDGIEPITKPKATKKQNPISKAKFKLKESKLKVLKLNNLALKEKFALRKATYVWKPTKDIWADEEKKFDNEYLKEADDYFKERTCQKPVKTPWSLLEKPSTLPAVEVPAPGASYRPTEKDRQELLEKAHAIELKKLKEEQYLDRVLTQMFPTPSEAPTQETWIKEMSQGLKTAETQDQEESSESEGDDLPLSVNPPTVRNPKVKSKRNKEKREKLLKQKIEKEKLERKRMNEIYKVKSIVADIKKAEKKAAERRKKRKLRAIKNKAKTLRLGHVKYENPDIEVLLSAEQKPDLRRLKPQGSIFQDRIKSLERRNYLEPRMRRSVKRKYKLKKYTKKSHKE